MLFDQPQYAEHEKVLFCADAACGLRAIISIHSTKLGPAAGGCRMYPYGSDQEALDDVLRLSRAMTYKNAMAGLALGGGKSVIIANPAERHSPKLLRAFGKQVQDLGGIYWTAEDVGVTIEGVEQIAQTTRFVFGTRTRPGAVGDPSPFTAAGVYAGMRAAIRHRLGANSVAGLTIAVQGVGSVGLELCRILNRHGARLIIADCDPAATATARRELDAQVVDPREIHRVDAEVFSPCALGGTVNDRTIASLRAKVVAGAANNPLASPSDGIALHERSILYAPDFIINAGGMIHASGEIFGRHDPESVQRSIECIFETSASIFECSQRTNTPPESVALALAAERLR
ncbi:MAG: Leu/Phe/Val dehydrogenase [Terriglobia bacterium]